MLEIGFPFTLIIFLKFDTVYISTQKKGCLLLEIIVTVDVAVDLT